MIMELKNKKIRWWRSCGGSPETNPRRSSRSTSRHHLTCAQAQRHTIFGISPSRHRLEFAGIMKQLFLCFERHRISFFLVQLTHAEMHDKSKLNSLLMLPTFVALYSP
ncbi:hypothetical protein HID58_071614 [Brassica napus]|uniref:Uncharacterized protein n=1 Tax=Brassica napus TaxID=3708 RepID=A0ABQ7Z290_BRANA|nr:hypothetical protein HID58_071614 [Brassica napus]